MKDRTFYNKLKKLRIELLYLNSYQSIALLTFITVMISMLYGSEYGEPGYKPYVYTTWLPFAFSVYFLKLLITIIYRKNLFITGNDRFWQFVFYFSTFLTGLVIGLSSIFVLGMTNEIDKLFIVLLISGISSGSTSMLSTSMTSFFIFNSLSLFPYIFYYLLLAVPDFRVVGYLLFIFMFTIIFTFFRIYKVLNRSLSLKIENDLIIEKLLQSEDKFTKSFYSGIAPMAMINVKKGIIIDVNKAMSNLLEYSREDFIGKNPYDFSISERPVDFIDIVLDTAREGKISGRNMTLITKNGVIKKCLINIETFKVENDVIAYFMLQDITKMLDYEKNLEYERDRAEEAAKAKANFLASMSHEIRTPMNSILGMTSLAMMSDSDTEKNKYLNTVKDSGEYLLALINDILDFSKIDAGKVEINLTDTSLPKLLDSVYRMMETHILNKKLEFIINTNISVPEFIKCDPERLKQILINLIGNAIKFTPEGSVMVNVRLSDGSGFTHISASGEFIEFSVKDTGIGIPEDKHEEIFKSFTQAQSSTFRKFGGTGLGLTISRQLIRLMEGDIKVISAPGKGSTFAFIIPLIHGEKVVEKTVEFPVSLPGEKKRILVAEDNHLNRKLIEAFMKKLGHEFALAENGEEVIKLLKNRCFDIILMDLEMPVINGYEAMKRIRDGEAGDENRNIIIHAMSAHVMQTTITKCIADGFNGYIIKPIDLKKLKNVLEKHNNI